MFALTRCTINLRSEYDAVMEKLALFKGAYYEGDSQDLRVIHPTPVVSAISCPFLSLPGGQQSVFREDSFDPVTRIRRGRLYISDRSLSTWYPGRIDHGSYHPHIARHFKGTANPITPDAVYDAWRPDTYHMKRLLRNSVTVGANEYSTRWHVVGAEWISVGHVLLTLRAHSLLGAIPPLSDSIADMDGRPIDKARVERALETFVDAIHRQQAAATVDVARETAKVILTAWVGSAAQGLDLAKVLELVPENRRVIAWSGNILNRFHSRGKSAAVEKHAARGSTLRTLTEDDADACASLIGLLVREVGWVAA